MADDRCNAWSDTRTDYFAGTKRELIDAGICKAGWFPKRLVAEVRRDGEPYLANNGKQRVKRTYVVEGHTPETTLTHRYDASGRETWVVSIAVTNRGRAAREAAHRKKLQRESNERRRQHEETLRQRALEEEAAAPVIARLRARYPFIRDIRGSIRDIRGSDRWTARGIRRQTITFLAPLEALVRAGLFTEEMRAKRPPDCDYFHGDLALGESFFASQNGDSRDWVLTLHTDDSIPERKHFPVTEARQLLRQIAGNREAS